MADSKTPTHTTFAFKREGRKSGRWLEAGTARAEEGGVIRVFIDRLPTGGWHGGVLLLPIGMAPPELQPQPVRPAPAGDVDDEE